ncbi:MAG: hypothetical protein P4L84_10510 [Isosphaeraceae bacterium]|nr:hypothetical protein [Isosphaeraceae bacterium]
MYVVVVLLQTLILPLASGAVELVASGGDPILVFGRWFLFWGVGTRLMLAGAVQVVRPAFTMRDILGQADSGTLVVVQELGFANLAMGTLSVIGAFTPGWWAAAAIPGAIFLGQAGLRHVLRPEKGLEERVATWTDLLVAAVMIVFVGRITLG